ncbi:uncharacterized protein LOC126416738 [Schistocerca serialis cubense]|uniref:uncharacterized protein LOC126416738 n=1 Tax=Schistocerca serialis cubense TaxID=2023355 RepID=UPI00214E11D4|nr:uncharacterized protein LOC126416738 [Schistocerca serialis cubense]
MWPAADVYKALPDFVLSFTIGRVIVFFLLLISYIVTFVIECLKVPLNVILFFLSAVSEETAKPFEGLRHSPHAHHSHSSVHPYGHVYSPDMPWMSTTPPPPPVSPPTPPRTVVLPGAQRGPVRVVEAVAREVSIEDVGPGRQLREPLVLRPRPRPVRLLVPVERPLQCVAQ